MTDPGKESVAHVPVQAGKLPGGPPLRLPNHPILQLTFDQKLQLCIGWLRDEFEAYQRGGGKDSLQAWVQAEIQQAQQAEGRPSTTAGPVASAATLRTVERKTPAAPPDPPPSEPGLESEGLGPIQWLIYGWEVKAGEGTVALGEWVIEELSGDSTDDGDDGTGDDGDGTGDDGDDDGGDDGTGGGGEGCFVAGTSVHTGDGDRVAIEEVPLDGKLASCDVETGLVEVGTVTRRFNATSVEVVTVAFADEALRCTPRHRFFTTSGWLAAGRMSPGTEVRCLDGATREVLDVRLEATETAVFNLQVDWQHTYYVGHAGYLVHNEKNQDPDGGTDGDGIPDGSISDKD